MKLILEYLTNIAEYNGRYELTYFAHGLIKIPQRESQELLSVQNSRKALPVKKGAQFETTLVGA
ncbi:hypothetical protein [Mesorhizobium sp. INR15]|uniref:hypothetical protein n=1 Tax=Mesorhizobium sp. INR15 TaxID=2654248 RepID=UPI00189673F6|nr:hypothetical protein [Mesorhizobium sp. INR15]QPC94042.1 hypothetical protein GA829_27550 [Mesorhizobium sp. INR15]